MKARLSPTGLSIPLIAVLVFSVAQPASAGGDMFLKIGGVRGEATDKRHEGWIAVEAFSWGEEQVRTFTSTGHGIAGRVSVERGALSATLTKIMDAASEALQRSAASGKGVGEVTFSFYQTDSEPPDYAVVTLKDAVITSVRPSSMSRGKERLEDVTLSFSKAQVTYKPIDDGD